MKSLETLSVSRGGAFDSFIQVINSVRAVFEANNAVAELNQIISFLFIPSSPLPTDTQARRKRQTPSTCDTSQVEAQITKLQTDISNATAKIEEAKLYLAKLDPTLSPTLLDAIKTVIDSTIDTNEATLSSLNTQLTAAEEEEALIERFRRRFAASCTQNQRFSFSSCVCVDIV